jgi:phi13 family phage major tail protein
MAEALKKYLASVGVSGFYYGVLDEATNKVTAINHVEFLQEIGVEAPQEVTKAYGDNKTAAMAVSGGDISVTGKFHAIPKEDKKILFGMEEVDGIMAMGSEDSPPMVAVVFYKTLQDKTNEYVGLTKGLFTRPKIEGQTQEEGKIEYGSDEIEGQFMDRKVDGFTKEKSILMTTDESAADTTNRDALFMKVFGLPHPDAPVTP